MRIHSEKLDQTLNQVLAAIDSVRSVKTMLFADVKAFSRLVEEKTGSFVEAFHGGISKLSEKLSSSFS